MRCLPYKSILAILIPITFYVQGLMSSDTQPINKQHVKQNIIPKANRESRVSCVSKASSRNCIFLSPPSKISKIYDKLVHQICFEKGVVYIVLKDPNNCTIAFQVIFKENIGLWECTMRDIKKTNQKLLMFDSFENITSHIGEKTLSIYPYLSNAPALSIVFAALVFVLYRIRYVSGARCAIDYVRGLYRSLRTSRTNIQATN